MANAGRILLMIQGAWSSANTYAPLDVVYHSNNSWVCKEATNTEPTDSSTKWQRMTSVGGFESLVTSLKNQVDAISPVLEETNANAIEAKQTAERVESGFSTLDTKVNGFDARITAATTSASTAVSTANTAASDVETLSDEVEDLSSSVDDLSGRFTSAETSAANALLLAQEAKPLAESASASAESASSTASAAQQTADECTSALSGKAPTSHAATTSTYGLGSTTAYGHVKTVNSLTTSAHASGLALSAYQGKVLSDAVAEAKSVADGAASDLTGKAPNSHASTATTYGVGTGTAYGHCMTINNLTTASNANGKCLSAYQGKVLNDKITSATDFSDSVTQNVSGGTISAYKVGVICYITYKSPLTNSANGTTLFTIPSGYRPKAAQYISAVQHDHSSHSGLAHLEISTAGVCKLVYRTDANSDYIYFTTSYVCA